MLDDAIDPIKAPKSARRVPHLERDTVVATALQLLNEVGFDGLTLRRLADKLGVKAAALYWHFENKQDLINQVAGAILDEEIARNPLVEGADWRHILMQTAYASRTAFMRYRDGALIIASADLSKSNMFRSRDAITRRLLEQGLSAELVTYGFFAVSRYTMGCALEEQADPYSADQRIQIGREMWPTIQSEYPAIAETITTMHQNGYTYNPDKLFEAGLQLILDGIAHHLAEPRAVPR